MLNSSRKIKWLCLFTFFFLGGCQLSEDENATWIWDSSLLEDQEKWLAFFEKKQVKDVYVQVNAETEEKTYRSFISAAHQRNIRVHALDGAPNYTESDLNSFLKTARALNWDGIHLDIEPYLSNQWKTNQKQAVYEYEQLIKKAAKSGLTLGVDIPFWFDEIPSSAGGTLAEFTITYADYVVIMAYRDSAERIIEAAETELAVARKLKKNIVIAVETIHTPEADGLSFFGKSAPYFEEEIKKVRRKCGCQIAVHHAESWQSLYNEE